LGVSVEIVEDPAALLELIRAPWVCPDVVLT
jgi:hypothetical protein